MEKIVVFVNFMEKGEFLNFGDAILFFLFIYRKQTTVHNDETF